MKEYVKPELFYESFELSEQIATGCSRGFIAKQHSDENTCTYNLNGLILFSSENGDCKYTGEVDGFCYHNGGEGSTIFSS